MMLILAVGGCPAPIPACVDTRTYVPSIVVADPGRSSRSAIVIGRVMLDRPVGRDLMAITLSRLDGDTVVATIDLALAPDGRFYWGLEPDTYVISRIDLLSDYAKGQYGTKRSFYPHLRFEAKGVRYIGQAMAITDSSLDDVLPAYLFAPGTPRQGTLGVRTIVISDDLQRERSRSPRPAAIERPDVKTVLMHQKPVDVYRVRTKTDCSRWKYWRLCFGPLACT
ncbi:MAG: hypothetical protein ACREEP_12980 [Dongiaceae bacterium]